MTELLSRHGLEVDEYAYYLHFFTKVVVDAVAFAHLTYERVVKHRQAWTWAEAAEAESSRAFKVYTRLFPRFRCSPAPTVFWVALVALDWLRECARSSQRATAYVEAVWVSELNRPTNWPGNSTQRPEVRL